MSYFNADFLRNFESICIHTVEKILKKDAKKSHLNNRMGFRKKSNEVKPVYTAFTSRCQLIFHLKIEVSRQHKCGRNRDFDRIKSYKSMSDIQERHHDKSWVTYLQDWSKKCGDCSKLKGRDKECDEERTNK